ncbi:MAG: 23S rRNA (pseudouridine(1915)-N(3))-methyltransferase RlmH [Deltaproteobacteria bacterium]|nr:23S rRNA (pseudouridine(1915)-N(3))-methyltransferase RlmH [Deltaproteobacteria bacterium]
MNSYRLLCVGRRVRSDPLQQAAADYVERLARYAKTELAYLAQGTIESERDALLARLAGRAFVAVLDERGEEMSTSALAKRVERWQQRSTTVAFVIGGHHGVHAEVKARAGLLLALSRMTLPHRLALVTLAEQLYRAHTLLRGEPYHRQ